MKKLIIALSIIFAFEASAQAQSVNINININVDKQPAWGPTGYEYAEFYYIPELNIYYDILNTLFYYPSGSRWVSARYLPIKYRRYDLYTMYKIVLNESQPWMRNKFHKKSYSQYKHDRTQQAIRYNSHSKYNHSRNNDIRWVDIPKPSNNNYPKTNAKPSNKNEQNNNTIYNSRNNNTGTSSVRRTATDASSATQNRSTRNNAASENSRGNSGTDNTRSSNSSGQSRR